MRPYVTRLVLFGILIFLLAYSWMTDQRAPAYPNGQFPAIIILVALALLVTLSVVSVVRMIRQMSNGKWWW
jgi:hypothetical protein